MADLVIYETHNGGDVNIEGKDLQLTDAIFNQPYIGLFGGNVRESTSDVSTESLERFDWWGNTLFSEDNEFIQFNSAFERTLQNVVLNSNGLRDLQNVLLEDLRYLRELAEITVELTMVGLDKLNIFIRLQQPETSASREFTFIWDATRSEMITDISNNN